MKKRVSLILYLEMFLCGREFHQVAINLCEIIVMFLGGIEFHQVTIHLSEIIVCDNKQQLLFSVDLFDILPQCHAVVQPLLVHRIRELVSDVF